MRARSWLNFQTSFGGDYTNVETDTVNTDGTSLPPGATQVNAAATLCGGSVSRPP